MEWIPQQSINTHFAGFAKPMGLAIAPNRIAVGTALGIFELHNVPTSTGKLNPAGRYDACFLPRGGHVTGDIAIHEMAYAGDELWFVNTRFSCLCVHDGEHSFIPRWRPRFVTCIAPEDRCHLNGIGIVDDSPRYVTAHGATDSAEGWRETKRDGGILIDIIRGVIVAFLKFERDVEEIFAVSVMPGIRFPELTNDDTALIGDSFVLPDGALTEVPKRVG